MMSEAERAERPSILRPRLDKQHVVAFHPSLRLQERTGWNVGHEPCCRKGVERVYATFPTERFQCGVVDVDIDIVAVIEPIV